MDNVELHRALGRVEAKVDLILERQKAQQENIESLKIWRAWTTGIAAAVAALISFFFK